MSTARERFKICICNAQYPASLEIGKVYRILPDSDAHNHGLVRVIDESGEDYLYPEDYFARVSLSREAKAAIEGVA